MNLLTAAGISEVFHYTPLHYLPFIARSNALKSKPRLREDGFRVDHFRSMSRQHDLSRGFGNYLHLTTHPFPPILEAKLAAGFPHLRLAIRAQVIESQAYDLCRFNVAMTRQLRRSGKRGFPESPTNGRYYGEMQIPIARTQEDKIALLDRHAARGEMVEVLILECLSLPPDTRIDVFSDADFQLASRVTSSLERSWMIKRETSSTPYPRSSKYAAAVETFTERALRDPLWLGDGLEFDRLKDS